MVRPILCNNQPYTMKVNLSKIDTQAPKDVSKSDVKKKLKKEVKKLRDLHHVLKAQGKHSVLIVLQGMDASGKDGTVRDVFKEIPAHGITVSAFKKPTDKEMSHDFLWRVHQEAPEKGMIKVFNRSHYEDVLIQRVHQWVDEDTVRNRMAHINNFEKLLADNGTVILKFFLHISKESQLKQLNQRKEDPTKYYKHNDNDFIEREHWDGYMSAYTDVLEKCDFDHAPWHVIPTDDRWYKNYLVAKTIVKRLESLDLAYPSM